MDVLERNGNVTDVETRDLSKNSGRAEPIAPSLPGAPGIATAAPAALRKRGSIFASDAGRGADALGLGAALRPLAELAAHRDAETPLTIGLLGSAGSGKTFALAALLGDVLDRVSSFQLAHITGLSFAGQPPVCL